MTRNRTGEWNRPLGLVLIVVGVFVCIAGMVSDKLQQPRALYVSGYSEQIAAAPAGQAAVDFSVTLHNPGSRPCPVVRIVPVVSERASHLVLQEPQLIAAGDRIDGGGELTYHSRFYIDTGMLTEEQIAALHPIIGSYVVTYDDNQEAVMHIRK